MISDVFIEYLKKVENGGKTGWNDDDELWYSHASPEGGNDTIGYGHKLLNSELEQAAKGLTDNEIDDLLLEDLHTASNVAYTVLSQHFNANFDDLCVNSQEMLIDFAYNLGGNGLRKFPKFVNAVIDDNIEVMSQEYKRYYTSGNGVKKELEQRNKEFQTLFLA
jgi:GH24 family phage-related lysozyme (muramidase)